MSLCVFCGQPLGFLSEHSNFFEFFCAFCGLSPFVPSSFVSLCVFCGQPLGFLREHSNFFESFVSFVDSSFVDNGRMASTHYIVGFVPAAGRARVWEDASNIT